MFDKNITALAMVEDGPEHKLIPAKETITMDFWMRVRFLLTGQIFIGERTRHDWPKRNPFNLKWCGDCQTYYVNYPHHRDNSVPCPSCIQRRIKLH